MQETEQALSWQKRIDAACDSFEEAWLAGETPDLSRAIAGFADNDRPAILRELVILDLAYRWQAEAMADDDPLPARPTLDDYAERFPELRPVEDLPAELIVEEFRVRQQAGDAPEIEEFLSRFPNRHELRGQLRSADQTPTINAGESAPGAGGPSFAGSGRFEILRPHAAGGLGQVSIAFDRELNREVALKEIKQEYADNPANRSRFTVEAEITGRLEHPGIVPIYGFGYDDEGRPYYAMRFIRGESLRPAIDAFHKSGVASFRSSLEFQRLLRRFVDVCNAVDFAHSRNVLHRDLKPANVMLGDYGETLVVDWGLAKLLDDESSTCSDATPPIDTRAKSGTIQGSIVGTPAYMSPEQAEGKVRELTAAADIYSLGAVLYHILTGRAPREETDAAVVLESVRRGEVPEPRTVRPGVPKSLEAVCLKAMRLSPADRYESAKALAADIELWLADEPVAAYREPVTQRTARWMKRHVALVSSAVIAITVAAVALVVVLAIQSESKRQVEESFASERKAKEEAIAEREEADRQRKQKEVVSDFLVGVFRSADPAVVGRDITVVKLLDLALPQIEQRFPDQPLVRAELLHAMGRTYRSIGYLKKSRDAIGRALLLRERHLPKDHPDTLETKTDQATTRMDEGDPEALGIFEEVYQKLLATLGADHAKTQDALANYALLLTIHGRPKEAIRHLEPLHQAQLRKFGPTHATTVATGTKLAMAYLAVRRPEEAMPLLDRNLQFQTRTLKSGHPRVINAIGLLGDAHLVQKNYKQAETLITTAVERARDRLGPKHGETLAAERNLGRLYYHTRRYSLAKTIFKDILPRFRRKFGNEHLKTNEVVVWNARTYGKLRDYTKAIPLWRESLDYYRRSWGDTHIETEHRRFLLAEAYQNSTSAEDPEKAVPLYERVLGVYRGQVAAGDMSMHNNLLLTLGNLGALYRTTGRAEKALPLLEEALTLKRKVYGNNSNSTRVAMLNLIAAYHSADQPEKATPHCRQAAALFTKHLKPGHSLIFTAKSLQGENYIRIQQPAAAEPICRECLEVRQKTIPDHFLTFNSMSLLGWSLSRQKKFKQAEPMLLNGYAGLKAREKKIPARARSMIDNAVRRIIEFYEAQDDTVKVREWKQKLIQQRTKKPLTSKGP